MRVVEGDRGLGGDPARELLAFGGEPAGLGVAEEEAAVDGPVAALHRNGKIAPHGEVPGGHAMVGGALPVARVLCDIIAAHDALAREGGGEHGRVARHRELRERLARHPAQRVERVAPALVVLHVVEEGAERRAGERRPRVRGALDDALQVEVLAELELHALQRVADVPLGVELLVKARVLVRARGAVPELEGELLVVRVERLLARAAEAQAADEAGPAAQRDRERVAQAERTDGLHVPLVLEELPERVEGEVVVDVGRAGGERAEERAVGVAGRVALLVGADLRLAPGVGVGDLDAAEAVAVEEVDRAVVGDARDGEARDALEDRLRLEALLREDAARLGEKTRAGLRVARLGEVDDASDEAEQRARGLVHGRDAHARDEDLAVRAAQRPLDAEGSPVPDRLEQLVAERPVRVVVHVDDARGVAHELPARVAEEALHAGVRVDDHAVPRADEEGGLVEDAREARERRREAFRAGADGHHVRLARFHATLDGPGGHEGGASGASRRRG